MTPEERKSWAYTNLENWLQEREEGAFFDMIDELTWAIEDLSGCPKHSPEGGHSCCLEHAGIVDRELVCENDQAECDCPDYLFGTDAQPSVASLVSKVEAHATIFQRAS